MTPDNFSSLSARQMADLQREAQAEAQRQAEQAAELEVRSRRLAWTWAAFICTCTMASPDAWPGRESATGAGNCPLHSGIMLHYKTGEVVM